MKSCCVVTSDKPPTVPGIFRDLSPFGVFDLCRFFLAAAVNKSPLVFSQNAGNQLKSLQKALKNPLGNAGLLAGELSKRAKRLRHSHTHTHTHPCGY